MFDARRERRCKCCGAEVASGRGYIHTLGVMVATQANELPVQIVRVLTCAAAYCVSRKYQLAKAG